MNRVLIVDARGDFPKSILEKTEYDFYIKSDIKETLSFLSSYSVLALILYGGKLPKAALHTIDKRGIAKTAPILVFCSEDKIGEAYSFGADEVFYGNSPEGFSAVLRRLIEGNSPQRKNKTVTNGEFMVSLAGYTCMISGKNIKMPKKEIELLYTMSSEPDRVFSRNELLDEVWGVDFVGDPRTVDVHIARVRKKIASEGLVYIKTVPRAGYKLVFEDLKVL